MSKHLKLADDLSLPLTAVTETFGVLAARGAGKSNLAAVMAEQMQKAGLPFVVIDPVGAWWGLRAGADGTPGGGLPIPIFGGRHGDVALERGGGELLADLVVSKRLSCVLDLSAFESESAKKAFLLAFAQRLYAKNTDPLHLFLEEADDYIPQKPMRDEAHLLRAWENIVRRGRSRGLGMTIITQRSASVNKSVLTQVQTLFAMRTTGPQDRDAIEAWVKYHDTDATLLASLPGLASGEGWVWSPQFLGRMTRHQFHRRQTFDSGATPKNLRGKDTRAAATLADIDLHAIQQQMAATIERAKADDPKALRQQIAKLMAHGQEQQLALERAQKQAIKKDVPVLTDADRARIDQLTKEVSAARSELTTSIRHALDQARADIETVMREVVESMYHDCKIYSDRIAERLDKAGFQGILEKLDRVTVPAQAHESRPPAGSFTAGTATVVPARQTGRSASGPRPAGDGRLNPAQQRILDAVAWWLGAKNRTPTRHQVAFVAGYTVNGHFNNMVGALRSKGLVDYPPGGGICLTETGHAAAAHVDAAPQFSDLVDRVLAVLDPTPGRLFKAVVAAKRDLTREELAALTGYTVNGHFNNMVGSLRSLGVIQYPKQGGVALGDMFEDLR